MSEDASAGRLYVDVEGDTSGFGRGLQQQIDAKTRGITAKIRAEVDDRRLAAEMRAAAKRAETEARIRARVEFDRTSVRDDLAKALGNQSPRIKVQIDRQALYRDLRQAVRDVQENLGRVKVKIAVDADTAEATRKIDEAAKDRKATIKADADTAKAKTEGERARREIDGKRASIKVDADTSKAMAKANKLDLAFGQIVGKASAFDALGGAIAGVVGSVIDLGGGLLAMAANGAQAIGVLAALPGAVGGIIQFAGVAMAGFSGVGNAVKAMTKAEQTATTVSSSSATARAAAAKRIQSAQQSLADAQERADRAAVDGAEQVRSAQEGVSKAREEAATRVASAARQVQDSERSLAAAQQDAKVAQQGLNAAREEAAQRLQDLNDQLKDSAFNEEEAAIAVERAKRRLDEINKNPYADPLDRREADLNYREALQRQAEIRKSNQRLSKEVDAANKAGVEGSTEVLAAKDKIQAANTKVADAERQLALDRADYTKAQRDGARQIADAQRAVAKAQMDAARSNADAAKAVSRAQASLADAMRSTASEGTKAATSARALDIAMQNLSPAGQRFARFLKDQVQPALKGVRFEIQDALLPSVQAGLSEVLTMVPEITHVGVTTAKTMGSLVKSLADMVTSPAWRKDFVTIGDRNAEVVGKLGASGLDLLDVVRNIVAVAYERGGMLDVFTDWVNRSTKAIRATVDLKRKNGDLSASLKRDTDVLRQWGRIWHNIFDAFRTIAHDSRDAGQDLTDSLEKSTEKFDKWTKDNQDKITAWFDTVKETTKATGDLIVTVAQAFGKLSGDKSNSDFVKGLNDKLVPALGRLLKAFQDSGGMDSWISLLTTLADTATSLVESGDLGTFADTLDIVAKALKAIVDNPVGTEVVGGILALAGIAGALGLVAGGLGKIISKIKDLKRIPGLATISQLLGIPEFGSKDKNSKGGKHRAPTGGDGKNGLGSSTKDPLGVRVYWRSAMPVKIVGGGAPDTTGGEGDTVVGGGGSEEDGKKGKSKKGGRHRAGKGAAGAAGTVEEDLAGAGRTGRFGRIAGAGAAAAGLAGALKGKIGEALAKVGLGSAVGGALKKVKWGTALKGLGKVVDGAFWLELANQITKPTIGLDIWGGLKSLLGGPAAYEKWSKDTADAIKKHLTPVWDDIKTAWGKGWGAVRTEASRQWTNFKSDASTIWGATKAEAGRQWNGVKGDITGAIDATKKEGSRQWTDFKSDSSKIWSGTKAEASRQWNGVKGDVTGAIDATKKEGARQWTNFKSDSSTIWQGTKAEAKRQWNGVHDDVTGAVTRVKTDGGRLWGQVRTDASTLYQDARNRLSRIGGGIHQDFITTKTNVTRRASETYTSVRNTASDWMGRARDVAAARLTNITDSFGNARDNIGRAWGGVKSLVAGPIRFLVETVYDNGIRAAWNKIDSIVGGKHQLGYIDAKFATGGMVPGYAPGRDSVRALLSPGEGILVPEAVRGLAGMLGLDPARAIQSVNASFSSRVPKPSAAGTRGGARGQGSRDKPQFGIGGWIADHLKSAISTVTGGLKDFSFDSLGALLRTAMKPVKAIVSRVLGSGDLAHRVPGQVANAGIDGLTNWLTNNDPWVSQDSYGGGGDFGGVPYRAGGAAVSRWTGLVHQVLAMLHQPQNMTPWVLDLIQHESGGNPVARNLWDINAQHGDPSGGLTQTIGATFRAYAGPFLRRGIFDPLANIYAGMNYGVHRYGSVANIPGIRSMMRGGPYLPYDSGGWLMPGTTQVVNATGKPEAVFTSTQWSTLEKIASQAIRSSSTEPAGQRIGTYIAEGAIQQTISNPVGETVEDTTNRRLRALAAFGLFGSE